MASVDKDGKGWRVRFMDHTGKRRTIRTGRTSKRNAEQIAMHIDRIVASKVGGEPIPQSTAAWISELCAPLRPRLQRVGLVPEIDSRTLGEFISEHIKRGKTAKNTDAAASTIDKWRAAQTHLEAFFGKSELLVSISDDHAAAFRSWLEDKPHFKTGNRRFRRLRCCLL